MKQVLFLCSANYYRSRFAEHFFNWLVKQEGLPWQADSRGLAVENWPDLEQISHYSAEALEARGIPVGEEHRNPKPLTLRDLGNSELVIALKEAEHRALMMDKFPQWVDRVEYWHIDDIDFAPPHEAIPILEEKIRELVASLRASEAAA